MAKVIAPLHSMSASGTVGKQMTHAATKNGHVVKRWSKPTGEANAAQQVQRAAYAAACAGWQLLTDNEKQTWTETGKAQKITGFNAYLSWAINQEPVPPVVPAIPLVLSDAETQYMCYAVNTSGSKVLMTKTTGGNSQLASRDSQQGKVLMTKTTGENSQLASRASRARKQLASWDSQQGVVAYQNPPGITSLDISCASRAGNMLGVILYGNLGTAPGLWDDEIGFVQLPMIEGYTNQYVAATSSDKQHYIMSGFDGTIDQYFYCTIGGYQIIMELPDTENQKYIARVSNDGAKALGSVYDGQKTRCCYWQEDLQFTWMPSMPDSMAEVLTGVAIGWSDRCGYCTIGDAQRAFFYNEQSGYAVIPALENGTYNTALSISDYSRRITGDGDMAGNLRSYIWHPEIGLELIALPEPFFMSMQTQISQDGSAVILNGFDGEYVSPMIYRL